MTLGMTCSACSARIEKSVAKLPGIKEVSVNLLKNSMVASYDESVLDTVVIVQAVEKAGYGAFPKSVQNKKQSVNTSANRTAQPEANTAQKEYGQMKKAAAFVRTVYHSIVLHIYGAYDGVDTSQRAAWYGKCNEFCFYTVSIADSGSVHQF